MHVPGRWTWLYPLTYLVHIAEEYWGGPGFAAWISRLSGAEFTAHELVGWNAAGWLFMTLGIALTRRSSLWRWVITTLGVIVFMNGALHVAASFATHSYSPGSWSGSVLWIPLGAFTLWHEARHAKRSTFMKGLLGAAVFHGVAALVIVTYVIG